MGRENIKQLIELSIVPNVSGKIYARNCSKGFTTELRNLPALELLIAVTEAYPSAQPPDILVQSEFYLKYETQIVEELKSRWSEGCPVLFDYVNYVWDELVDALQLVKNKDINLECKTDEAFQKVFDAS